MGSYLFLKHQVVTWSTSQESWWRWPLVLHQRDKVFHFGHTRLKLREILLQAWKLVNTDFLCNNLTNLLSRDSMELTSTIFLPMRKKKDTKTSWSRVKKSLLRTKGHMVGCTNTRTQWWSILTWSLCSREPLVSPALPSKTIDDLKIVETYPEVHAFVKRMQEHKIVGPHLVQ